MRDWNKVFEEFKKPLPLKDLTSEMGMRGSAKPYAEKDSYIARLVETLGYNGFRIECTEPTLQNVQRENGTVRPVWTVTCKLTLYDENGHYYTHTTQTGTGVVKGDADNNIGNALRMAAAAAIKACCAVFGIGADNEEVWEAANGRRTQARSNSQQPQQTQQQPQQQKKQAEPFSVIPAGELKDGRNGSFYIPVSVGPDQFELWFYEEQSNELAQTPSNNGLKNRLADIRDMWAKTRRSLPIMAQRAASGNKLYFRGFNKTA